MLFRPSEGEKKFAKQSETMSTKKKGFVKEAATFFSPDHGGLGRKKWQLPWQTLFFFVLIGLLYSPFLLMPRCQPVPMLFQTWPVEDRGCGDIDPVS